MFKFDHFCELRYFPCLTDDQKSASVEEQSIADEGNVNQNNNKDADDSGSTDADQNESAVGTPREDGEMDGEGEDAGRAKEGEMSSKSSKWLGRKICGKPTSQSNWRMDGWMQSEL